MEQPSTSSSTLQTLQRESGLIPSIEFFEEVMHQQELQIPLQRFILSKNVEEKNNN